MNSALKKISSYCYLLVVLSCLTPADLKAQWTQITNPSDNALYSVDIHSSGLCMAAGIDIVKSTDFGQTWEEIIFTGPSALFFESCVINSVRIINNTTIVAAGWYLFDNNHVIIRSTNSGVDWSVEFQGPFGSGKEFRSVEFFDENTGLAVGEQLIYRTTDGGDTWSSISGAGADNLNDIIWLSATQVIIVGENRILRSSNGGLSYTIQPHAGKLYKSISEQPSTGKLYACYNQAGDTYQSASTDGGFSWSHTLVNNSDVIYNHQAFNNDSIIYGFDNSVQISYNEGIDRFLYTDYVWSSVRNFTFKSGVGLLVAGVLSDAEIFRYDMNAPPDLLQIVNFTYEDSICIGAPTTYEPDHKSCDSWEWFVNGTSVSNDTTLIFTHSTQGITQIKLVTIYNGVSDTVSKNVMVLGPPVVSSFNVLSQSLICSGNNYTLSIQSLNDQTGYKVYKDGVPISPAAPVGSTLNYNIGAVNTDLEFIIQKWAINECDSVALTDTFNLEVEPLGNINTAFYLEDTLLCSGDSTQLIIPAPEINYVYDIYKNGLFLTAVSNATGDSIFVNTFAIYNNTEFSIEVKSPILACSHYLTHTATVDIDLVEANFTVSAEVLLNDTLNITTLSIIGSTFNWNTSGSPSVFEDSTGLTPLVAYDSTGIYNITVDVQSAILGCADTHSETFQVFKPVPDSVAKEVCWVGEKNLPHRIMDKHVDIFGNLIVVGFYEDTTAWPYPNYLGTIQKYDADGNLLWDWVEAEVSSTDDHHSSMIGSVASDSEGNLYVTGTVYGAKFKYGWWLLFNESSNTCELTFVMKLDPDGNFLWWVRNTETLAGHFDHGGGFSDVAVYEQENKILVPCVKTSGPFEFTSGEETVSSSGINVFIIDLDGNYINHLNASSGTPPIKGEETPQGTTFWPNSVHTSPEIFIGDNGVAYLIGEYQTGYMYFGPYTITGGSPNRYGFAARMNPNSANPSWLAAKKTFECSEGMTWPYTNSSRSAHMTYDAGNNIYQCVNHTGNLIINGDTSDASSAGVILKYDENLNFVWQKNFSNVNFHDVFCANGSDLYFEGVMTSNFKVFDDSIPEYMSPLQEVHNIYFGSLDALTGDLTWMKQFGETHKEFVDPIGGNSCGDVYFSGQSSSSYFELSPHTSFQFDLNGVDYGLLNGTFMFKLTDSSCVSGGCNIFCLDSNLFPSPVIVSNSGVLETGNFSSYQWYLNGNLLSGMTSQNLVPADSGQYSVLVTNANGCMGQSSEFDLCDHIDYIPAPIITFINDSLTTGLFSSYQWYHAGNAISGGTQQSVYCNANGYYNVEVSNQWGCTSFSPSAFLVTNASVSDYDSEFLLYPNPTSENVKIHFYNEVPLNMYLTDINGKIIETDFIKIDQSEIEIDFSNLENGVYIFHLFWMESSRHVRVIKI